MVIVSGEEAFHDLLCQLFDAAHLRRFLRFGEQGDALARALPGDKAALAELVDAAVAELVRRALIATTLQRLHAEFPSRHADIDRVASLWPGLRVPAFIPGTATGGAAEALRGLTLLQSLTFWFVSTIWSTLIMMGLNASRVNEFRTDIFDYSTIVVAMPIAFFIGRMSGLSGDLMYMSVVLLICICSPKARATRIPYEIIIAMAVFQTLAGVIPPSIKLGDPWLHSFVALHGGKFVDETDANAFVGMVCGYACVALAIVALVVRKRLSRSTSVAAAFGLIVASAGSWVLWKSTRPQTHTVEQTRTVETGEGGDLDQWEGGEGQLDEVGGPEITGPDPLVALADVAPMKFRKLPGGTFDMGSPQTERLRIENPDFDKTSSPLLLSDPERLHPVEVSPFELAVTEVTNAQWKAVMGASPNHCNQLCADTHPVQNVTWLMAVEYLNELTAREMTGLTPCYEQRGNDWAWVKGCTGYRLPTEAEWEYAARAGTKSAYSFGDDPAKLGEHAWFMGNSDDKTHPVREKLQNPWGLHDMHGNVWEWVWDWYDDEYDGFVTRNPRGPQNGAYRVLRGGSFRSMPVRLRSAERSELWWLHLHRYGFGPSDPSVDIGFRCARGSPPAYLNVVY
jgi:formylglycine-generating enzyme required for sulfatase activity